MRADIDMNGVLTITSETELEAYAAKMWFTSPVNAATLLGANGDGSNIRFHFDATGLPVPLAANSRQTETDDA